MTPSVAARGSAAPSATTPGFTDGIPMPRLHTADLLVVVLAIAMALVLALLTFVAAHRSHRRDRDRA